MEEIWKDIDGYEGLYQVSNHGNVKSVDRHVRQKSSNGEQVRIIRGRLLKQRIQNNGYYIVWLCKNGVSKVFTVHRLVANAFIPNLSNKKDVNHKNGVKTDNGVYNLEWCSRSENIKHSYNILKHQHWKTKIKCKETNIVYDSIRDASRKLGINASSIGNNIHGRNKSVSNLHFEKIKDYLS